VPEDFITARGVEDDNIVVPEPFVELNFDRRSDQEANFSKMFEES
jgi:hypothetical protein